jgi:hypothetical protein
MCPKSCGLCDDEPIIDVPIAPQTTTTIKPTTIEDDFGGTIPILSDSSIPLDSDDSSSKRVKMGEIPEQSIFMELPIDIPDRIGLGIGSDDDEGSADEDFAFDGP